jgi:hypothetical protein
MDNDRLLKTFNRLYGDSDFLRWLDEERASAVKYLVAASDPVLIHRAQGKAVFIEEILKLLDKAKSMR